MNIDELPSKWKYVAYYYRILHNKNMHSNSLNEAIHWRKTEEGFYFWYLLNIATCNKDIGDAESTLKTNDDEQA